MASVLDGPPPSPALSGGVGGGGEPPAPTPRLNQLVQPADLSQGLPPEMLQGALQAADVMAKTLDGFAQAFPPQAAQFQMIKSLLAETFAQVLQAGAPSLAPTATGSPFPGTVRQGGV